MAHSKDIKGKLRATYIFDNLNLEQAAQKLKISSHTASRWKREAKRGGDDWDKLKSANLLAGDGIEAIARQMLADYINQHKSVMDEITQGELPATAKASALASLADSFNKTVAASRRVLPEVSELAIALSVMQLLQKFIMERYPQHGAAFLEILEPFGEEISRAYG